jgi:hypothetical protein
MQVYQPMAIQFTNSAVPAYEKLFRETILNAFQTCEGEGTLNLVYR